ncbi:uncharacterized protein LOC128611752 isoform X1 [Ictalurus furcatus]|uniref:uncharacterized protein LOC128611752 isoform X1 n=1 Tax=Ictalurus furcatus TaxID=66913 RepID=UPI002350E532|nr:uncharacterized protein LOC128611752 isoform X1 [Ictalurus furcatus]
MTRILSHPEPCDVGEAGVTSVTTSDMHIENVMNKDTVGLSIQQEYSVYDSVAKRFGAESCIQESPALKVQRICDKAKRQDPTSSTLASSNRGSLPNMETENLMNDGNKPTVTAESEFQSGNVKSSTAHGTIQTQLRPSVHTASESPSPESALLRVDPDFAALRLELLASLRKDIADIFKKELQETLGDALSTIKLDLQAMKTQLVSDKVATDATISTLKGTVVEMEHALSGCTDAIAQIKTTIESLTATVTKLENKYEDLESTSWRNNIRIVGVPEGPDTCTTAAVAALLKEAFGLEKEPVLDRTLQPKPKPGERPRAIVCRFHYHSDCVDILRRVRELQRMKVRDLTILVFPDHTAKIARARAAFNEVRHQLRGIEGARLGFALLITVFRRTLFQWRKRGTMSNSRHLGALHHLRQRRLFRPP